MHGTGTQQLVKEFVCSRNMIITASPDHRWPLRSNCKDLDRPDQQCVILASPRAAGMSGLLASRPVRTAVRHFQPAAPPRHPLPSWRQPCRASLGSDAASGFLDLAKLVSSEGSGKKTPFDGLASKLGELPSDC